MALHHSRQLSLSANNTMSSPQDDSPGRTIMSATVGHKRSRQFQCSTCSREFKTQFSLQRHSVIHTGQRPYVCVLCTSSFSQNGHLVAHTRKIHGNFLHCPRCLQNYSTIHSLQSHLKICNLKGDKTNANGSSPPLKRLKSSPSKAITNGCLQSEDQVDVNCNKCNSHFQSLKSFLDHLCGNNSGGSSSTTTTISKKFSSSYSHSKENNSSESESVVTNSSPNTPFSYQVMNDIDFNSRFNQDLITSLGVPSKDPNMFTPGGGGSGSSNSRRSHGEAGGRRINLANIKTSPHSDQHQSSDGGASQSEEEESPQGKRELNQCHGCGVTIRSVYNFRRHLAKNKKVNSIGCPLCDSVFEYDCAFQKHYRAHQENSGRFHRCEICTKFFTTATSLRYHIKSVHLNDRPFACPHLCGKQYAKASDLRKHLSQNHDDTQSVNSTPGKSPYFH